MSKTLNKLMLMSAIIASASMDEFYRSPTTKKSKEIPHQQYALKQTHTYHIKGHDVVATSKKDALKKLTRMGLISKKK